MVDRQIFLSSSVISRAQNFGRKHSLDIVSPPGPVPASVSNFSLFSITELNNLFSNCTCLPTEANSDLIWLPEVWLSVRVTRWWAMWRVENIYAHKLLSIWIWLALKKCDRKQEKSQESLIQYFTKEVVSSHMYIYSVAINPPAGTLIPKTKSAPIYIKPYP